MEKDNQGSGRWCILRTAPSRTLTLQESLAAAGIEAWTPRLVLSRRKRRSKVMVDIPAPITPTFVFVREEHLGSLVRALSLAINPHPPFSIFRYAGCIPLISEREMKGLRAEEEHHQLVRLKTQRPKLEPGQQFRLAKGAYTGITGVVKDGRGRFAAVDLGGSIRVKVASWLLGPNSVEGSQPLLGTAA